jgi:hypothetical protein
MGSIGKERQFELDRLADSAEVVWKWNIGTDVNPRLINEGDLKLVYDAIHKEIGGKIDEIANRVGQDGNTEDYLRGSLFPKIWITLEARGIFYDFEYDSKLDELVGEIRPAKAKDLRRRLLRRRTDAYRLYREWNRNNRSSRTAKRKVKHASQIRWNQEVADSFNDMALLAIERPSGSLKDQLAEMAVGFQWFLARRPWAELCLRADFRLVDGPAWADGWLEFSGHAKKTLAEKEGTEADKAWAIPVFGVDPERLLEAFQIFRSLLAREPWYDPAATEGNIDAKTALYYSTEKVLRRGFVARAFEPVLAAGYEYKITMHRFRDLYVSRGHWYQSDWSRKNGLKAGNIESWAAQYLGHFGDGSEEDTGEYLRLEFLGPDPIPVLVG